MMRDKGELVAVVSMDLSKAFDVIQYPLLHSKLKAYGMNDASCALLRNYLWQISENQGWGHLLRLEKRQTWGPAGECVRSNVTQHFHQRSLLPRQEGQAERLC